MPWILSHSLVNYATGRWWEYVITIHIIPFLVIQTLIGQAVFQYIRCLFQGINWIDLDRTIRKKSEEVVLRSNLFCAWSKLWALIHFDAAAIIFPDRAETIRGVFSHEQELLHFFHQIEEW